MKRYVLVASVCSYCVAVAEAGGEKFLNNKTGLHRVRYARGRGRERRRERKNEKLARERESAK